MKMELFENALQTRENQTGEHFENGTYRQIFPPRLQAREKALRTRLHCGHEFPSNTNPKCLVIVAF